MNMMSIIMMLLPSMKLVHHGLFTIITLVMDNHNTLIYKMWIIRFVRNTVIDGMLEKLLLPSRLSFFILCDCSLNAVKSQREQYA